MAHESFRHLRTDRRLLDRRGWISREDLEQELTNLPDVASKIAPPEEREPSAAPGAEEPAEEA